MREDAAVNLRPRTLDLRVTPSSHAPTPFYISSRGYGIAFNVARALLVKVGCAIRKDNPNPPEEMDRTTNPKWNSHPETNTIEAGAVGTGMEIFVFAGKTPLEIVQRFNLYCGGGCLPPRWSLGFWDRMPTKTNASQVQEEIDEFQKRDIPLDVLGLEPGWQSAAYPCSYEWDSNRFPNPSSLVHSLLDKGIRVNLWENMFVSKKAPIFKQLEPYFGSHTYWSGQVPDYTIPAARDILLNQHRKNHLEIGVSGYKVDEVDELSTPYMLFPSGLCGEQMRQIHGLVIQKAYTNLFRSLNRRTCGLARASNLGGSSYPFALYTDDYDHRNFIHASCNSSLSGVLWCPEVRDAKSDEDWVRRFETALFSPIMQLNGWKSGAKLWSRPEVTDTVRDLLRLRSQFVPYLYTAMADYYQYGIPPIRHMILEEGSKVETVQSKLDSENNSYADGKSVGVSDEYMFGPNLLVAPLVAGETKRKVILPKGKWFDFYTGKLVGDGGAIIATAPLNQIPLFVKDGGIIPLMPAVNHIQLTSKQPITLEIRHYGEKEGSYRLYDDDGETFDFEHGISSRQELKAILTDGKLTGKVADAVGPWKSRYTQFSWKFMTAK